MARVTAPLLSATARGSWGGALTFRMMNGRAYASRLVARPPVTPTITSVDARLRVRYTRRSWSWLHRSQAGWVYSYKDVKYYTMLEFWNLALAAGEFQGPYPVARFAEAYCPWGLTFVEQISADASVLTQDPLGNRAYLDFLASPGIFAEQFYQPPYPGPVAADLVCISHLMGYPRMIPETIVEHQNDTATNVNEGWWTIAEPPGFTPPAVGADGKQRPARSTVARLGKWRRGEKSRAAKLFSDFKESHTWPS